ncbi:hypothetical protein [Chitinibacter sp. ZOR0017]|uniref:hypothetical protein n=1 Tax=Chitinibacter sp. ZOR0017 TaxID=1339254 RepID=UPI0006465A7F|nr:hypothetical protein [Chitinibacter sp. ZOR0017]
MLTCREVSSSLTLQTETPPTLYRQLQIRLHLLICHHCRRNRRQLQALNALLASEAQTTDHAPSLPEPAKARLRAKLEAANKD